MEKGSVGLQSPHQIAFACVCVFRLEKNRVAGILRRFIVWIGLDWTMDEGREGRRKFPKVGKSRPGVWGVDGVSQRDQFLATARRGRRRKGKGMWEQTSNPFVEGFSVEINVRLRAF